MVKKTFFQWKILAPKLGPLVQIPYKNCQTGEISPNLVTLLCTNNMSAVSLCHLITKIIFVLPAKKTKAGQFIFEIRDANFNLI
jgi:hypothetical protein